MDESYGQQPADSCSLHTEVPGPVRRDKPFRRNPAAEVPQRNELPVPGRQSVYLLPADDLQPQPP